MESFNVIDEVYWTPEAQVKLRMIPFFARPQARHKIEEMTRAAGLDKVTADIVLQARVEFGQ